MKVRKKPMIIEAHQLVEGEPLPQGVYTKDGRYFVDTLEGLALEATPGCYIMTGFKGEHWAIQEDIFNETYEVIEP